MISFIKYGIVMLAALALAGCSKTEEFYGNPDSALQIESVSGISPFSLMQEPVTKAVITGNTLPDSEAATGIGIFVTESEGSAYDGHNNGYSNVNYANSDGEGFYWSSSESNDKNAYNVYFRDSYYGSDLIDYFRYYGFSVRLVTESK